MESPRSLNEKLSIDPAEILAWRAFFGCEVRAMMLPHKAIIGVESVALSRDGTRVAVTLELDDKRMLRLYFNPGREISADVIPTAEFLRAKTQEGAIADGFTHENELWRNVTPRDIPAESPEYRLDPFNIEEEHHGKR